MKYIHAGNATQLVEIAHKTKLHIYLHRGHITVDAKSILGVMSLVFFDGVSIETEAHEVAQEIRELFE